jgi:hypothetical protein
VEYSKQLQLIFDNYTASFRPGCSNQKSSLAQASQSNARTQQQRLTRVWLETVSRLLLVVVSVMVKIIDKIRLYDQPDRPKEPFFSFEYFPPKTDAGVENL